MRGRGWALIKTLVPCGVALVAGVAIGAAAYKVRLATKEPVREDRRNVDVSQRKPAPCPAPGPRTLALLVVGQSHAANAVGERFVGVPGTYQLFGGRCYEARDPALGAEGLGGNLWTLVANRLVGDKAFDSAVVAFAAVGSVPVRDWAPGGSLHAYLRAAAALPPGLAFNRVVISEGATDRINATDPAAFKRSYGELIEDLRGRTGSAPIFVSLETGFCSPTDVNTFDPKAPVRLAVESVVDPARGIFAGADMDNLVGVSQRYDGCHLSKAAAETMAAEWAKLLR